ncbi:glycine-rich domain-containing protein [Streptomyces sp. NPDC048362]|uniref:glycine-rich domain-containing protein n=1 Tax=Streptomyces sp. NPDC048362 TaxID=3365539 RepID=UPI0037242DCD
MTLPPGATPPVLARMLVTDDQFTSCRLTVMDANPDMPASLASRIVEEALKFVAACSANPGAGLVPSRIVDEGWHALIVHTSMYAELCERLGDGRFIHHAPGYGPENWDPSAIDRTRAAIEGLGWDTDRELWVAPSDESLVSVAAKCQHSDDGGPIVIIPKKPGVA